MKYLASILILLTLAGTGQAQMTKDPGGIKLPPGRSLPPGRPGQAPVQMKSYPDSAKFVAAFKEFYPLIKPTPGPRERAQQTFHQMSRMFKARGVDSAAAYDSVMKKIDDGSDEKVFFDTYRREFTAEELKALTAFYKSPAGKHYLEVESKLTAAHSQAASVVQRTVASTIQPMMKPLERPARPGQPGAPGGGPGQGPGGMNGHPMPNRMPPPHPMRPDSMSH